MSIPWNLVNFMHPCIYHESLIITWVNVYTMSPEIQITKKKNKTKYNCYKNKYRNFLSDFVIKLLISFINKNILWLVSGNGCFQKVSLVNSISKQMLRVWSRAIWANILLRRKLRRKKITFKRSNNFLQEYETEHFV